MMRAVTNRFGCIPVLVCILAPAIASAAAEDPLIFTMPQRAPEFREVLKGADWDKQFAKAKAELGDLDALATSNYPAAGALIDSVKDEGQAAALGMKAGDVISEVDGRPLEQRDLKSVREDHDQQITVISPDGTSRELIVHGGLLGINTRTVVRPELFHLRHGARDPRWDAFAAVGAAECFRNPNLAETAWHRALRAGYAPDALSEYCGAQIAARQGRNADAVAWCALLDARPDVPDILGRDRLAQELAIANFKIEQALGARMIASPDPVDLAKPGLAEWLQALLDAHRNLPEARRTAPSPSEIASYVKTSLMKEMEPWPHQDEPTNRYRRDARDILARQDKPFEIKVPSLHYRVLPELPKVEDPDVELIVRATMKLNAPVVARGVAKFFVGLIDGDDPAVPDHSGADRHRQFLSASVEAWGTCLVSQRGNQERELVVQAVNAGEAVLNERQFALRLIHAAGRDEVWVDDRRLLYLPALRNPRKIGFRLYVTGVDVGVRVAFAKLDPSQVPAN